MVIIKIYLSRKSWHLVAGYTAARDTNTGTPFVRAINDVFRAHAKSDDIGGLLIRVEIYFLVIGRKKRAFLQYKYSYCSNVKWIVVAC